MTPTDKAEAALKAAREALDMDDADDMLILKALSPKLHKPNVYEVVTGNHE